MYNEKGKIKTIKYIKEKTKIITIRYRKEDWATIEPEVAKSGLPIATYVKKAITEKIEREKEWK